MSSLRWRCSIAHATRIKRNCRKWLRVWRLTNKSDERVQSMCFTWTSWDVIKSSFAWSFFSELFVRAIFILTCCSSERSILARERFLNCFNAQFDLHVESFMIFLSNEQARISLTRRRFHVDDFTFHTFDENASAFDNFAL